MAIPAVIRRYNDSEVPARVKPLMESVRMIDSDISEIYRAGSAEPVSDFAGRVVDALKDHPHLGR